ncbi:MAG: hypothetical protein V4659_05030 [Pseudomonadota bacterium]
MPVVLRLLRFAVLLFLAGTAAASAQTRVENVATLSFAGPAAERSIASNRVVTDVAGDADAMPGRPESRLLVTKFASVRDAAPGDLIQYRITVINRGDAAARAVQLIDTLPLALRYRAGSTRGAAEPAVARDGRTLTFTSDLAAGATLTFSYVVGVVPGAAPGEAVNRIRLQGALAGDEAAASVRIRALLFSDALTLIGRVSEGACGDPARNRRGIAGVRLLLEDGTYVVTDRDGRYHFEGVRVGRHVVQLDPASIPATHAAVACDSDSRQAGSALSRFVEGTGGLLKRIDFQLRPTGRAVVATPLPVAIADDATAAGNRDWLSGATPGTDWLFPAAGHNPRAAALRVVVKHAPDQRVALTLNGQPIDPLAFDGSDNRGGVAVSTWTGLPLVPGDNRLVARVLAADGTTATTLERSVHYAGPPTRAVFDTARSRLVADGLTRPLLAVRVTDAGGHPVRAGTLVAFRVEAPHTAALEADLQQARQLAGTDRALPTARVVGDDGYAFLALQPTTQAGAVRAHTVLTDQEQTRTTDIRAWLSSGKQDWVVVGFGAGSIGYDTLDRRRRPLLRTAGGASTDGQLALYAKGRIKGAWLLTIAYDSDRRHDPDRGLLGTIDPDRYYTVYGDGSQQGYDAPTRRKLYLRLEAREFYALFGDFESGLTDTQLGRYSRTLNGAKAAFEGERVRASGFVAHTGQRFVRDELQGNGLSGPYRLRSRGIVPNSDKLRLEVRDRYRSERIVKTTALTRHLDYDIDTRLGTIRFRDPVLSRDSALNPVFIVADYEVAGIGAKRLVAAGRAALRIGAAEIGASAIRDDSDGRATVLALDARAKLGTATELRAEYAVGGSAGLGAGDAWLAEIAHHGPALDGIVYARQQDVGFGVGQQNLVEAGTRKFGADGRVRLTERLSLAGTGWYQDNLAGPGTRLAGDARLEYARPAGTLYAGLRFARDRGLDRPRDSRLLTLGGTQTLLGGKVDLSAETQFAPGGTRDSVDFPVRHQLGVAWRLTPGIRLLGGYEIADGRDFDAQTARVGFDVAAWTGAKLTGTLNQQAIGESGARSFAQYGLTQSLPLGKRWTLNATLDAANTLNGRIPAGAVLNQFHPVASGGFLGQDALNEDYAALTLGATYRGPAWSANGRLEYRDADTGRRWGLTANVLRALGEGRTLAGSLRGYRVTDRTGAVAGYAAADLALAWRPLDRRWSVLDRLSLRYEGADAGFTDRNVLGVPAYGAGVTGGEQVTRRLINNFALNYRTGAEGNGHGLEATLYYGVKYVRGRFADDVYSGFIDVTGFDLRKDLGRRVDIGVQGSVQHAWGPGAWTWSGGPSLGIAPAANLWLSAGYNLAGYRDRDFDDDRYTRAGPYLTLRLKFDQLSLKALGK